MASSDSLLAARHDAHAKALLALCVVLLCALLSVPAVAQNLTGSLQGRIVDESGAPIEAAVIAVTSPSLLGMRTASTDSDGRFRIPGLAVGTYSVQVTRDAYQSLEFQGVVIQLGKTTSLPSRPLPQRFQAQETVVVHGRKMLVDVTSTDVGMNLTSRELDVLPTERDYRSAIAFLPQANTSFYGDGVNVGGATGSENLYAIDGVNVTDPYQGASGMGLPHDFVEEIQLVTGGYQAEFGRSNGGIVNVVTRTGSNEFKGELYGYFSNNDFAADSRRGALELAGTDFKRYDIGLNVGGPIARDQLWYFLAYDPSVEIEDVELPGHGIYRDERIAHQFAGKLTWRSRRGTRLDLTAFGDPTRHDRVGSSLTAFGGTPVALANPDPFLSEWNTGGWALSLNGHHVFGHRVMLEGNVSRFDSREKSEPMTERGRNEPLFQDNTTGVWSGGTGNIFDHHSVRAAGKLIGTVYLGPHELKAGAEYEQHTLDDFWVWMTPDGDAGRITKDAEDEWISSRLFVDGKSRFRHPAAFVQDSWQVTNRLRINAGLRWDGMYYYDGDDALKLRVDDQFAPRAGLVFQAGRDREHKLFASYGRFFEQLPTFMPAINLSSYFQDWINWGCDPRAGCTDTLFAFEYVVQAMVDDLKGQHYDEYALGYERVLGGVWTVGLVGSHRELREAIQDTDTDEWFNRPGNPGRGELDFMPNAIRRYSALELTLRRAFDRNWTLSASYVLSRTYGNFVGAFDTDAYIRNANSGAGWTLAEQIINGEGRLPNDRPHVFKVYGARQFDFGLTAGGFMTVQSGTPLSEFGAHPFGSLFLMHLRERGTAGRMPWLWDLSFRFSYDLGRLTGWTGRSRQRITLDVLHAFGQREAVALDQRRYLATDALPGDSYEEIVAGQKSPNPYYLSPLAYQPPMTIRLGAQTTF